MTGTEIWLATLFVYRNTRWHGGSVDDAWGACAAFAMDSGFSENMAAWFADDARDVSEASR